MIFISSSTRSLFEGMRHTEIFVQIRLRRAKNVQFRSGISPSGFKLPVVGSFATSVDSRGAPPSQTTHWKCSAAGVHQHKSVCTLDDKVAAYFSP
jgi:hypothetical protein